MRGRHYSEFPFTSRRDGGPRDAFEHDALRHLEADPSRPFIRFAEDAQGRPALLYATARVKITPRQELRTEAPEIPTDLETQRQVAYILAASRRA